MSRIILVLVFLIGGLVQAQNVSLEVKMTGFENNNGKVKVGLYNSEEGFLKTVYKNAVVDIQSNTATFTFKDLPKGIYAVSVYHDENANGILDKNGFGMPTEGYGTSNDAKGFMGPPAFADAKFALSKNSKITININN
ncbi:DUF2141 domain-containing protein [Flavobacterium sp.]|uniref:DUF2141 domain-containing protein n=1 Tax=Flavobacterium sp. TaxID=239 RepID=UPI0039E31675